MTDSVTLEAAIIAAEVLLTIVDELRLSTSNQTYLQVRNYVVFKSSEKKAGSGG